jgi:pimeloyl-ACP methyl ester carboxylesterase
VLPVEIRQGSIEANGLHFETLTCGDDGPVASGSRRPLASGSRRPLALCLHGFPDSPHTWRHLLPNLAAAGYRAVAPWLRGYAPTDIPADGDYRIATLAADANALHAALGGDGDAVLIGHDWGAMTSYAAGAGAPERWRRIVAIAVPPPRTAGAAFLAYAQLKRSFYVFLFQTSLAPLVAMDDLGFLDRLWADWSPSYDGSVDLPRVKDALRDPDNLMAAIGYYRAMFDSGGGAGTPPQPTLYLHGDADGAFGVEGIAGAASELSAESRVEVLSGVGHFLHLERPAEVNRLILDWLTPSRRS